MDCLADNANAHHHQDYICLKPSQFMNSDDDLEKMYAELEARYGDSLEGKSAEAFRQSTKKRLSVEVITDSENNPLRVSLTFGPHHFVVVGMADEKVHVLKGETHHGTMYDASTVGSEWESLKADDGRSRVHFDELPDDHRRVTFSQSVDDLTLYYLRPGEE